MSRDRFTITSLDISGNHERAVANQFIQQERASEKLAIMYPGLRYSCDKPLLYYTTELLLSRGYDVLQLWSNYGSSEFNQLSQAEQTVQLIQDGHALLNSGIQSGTYSQRLLCGKSLGTLTMAFILNEDQNLTSATTVWFTPLIHLPPVSQAILNIEAPAFVAGSQADSTFSAGPADQIISMSAATTFVIDHADHSLEIPGDTLNSLQILNQIMVKLSEFIS